MHRAVGVQRYTGRRLLCQWPQVQYYTMGSNQWQSAAAWPLPATVPTTYFLHSGGRANRSAGLRPFRVKIRAGILHRYTRVASVV